MRVLYGILKTDKYYNNEFILTASVCVKKKKKKIVLIMSSLSVIVLKFTLLEFKSKAFAKLSLLLANHKCCALFENNVGPLHSGTINSQTFRNSNN